MGQKKGHKFTEEHKKNLSRARRGYKHTEEARKKMSESQRNRSDKFEEKLNDKAY